MWQLGMECGVCMRPASGAWRAPGAGVLVLPAEVAASHCRLVNVLLVVAAHMAYSCRAESCLVAPARHTLYC